MQPRRDSAPRVGGGRGGGHRLHQLAERSPDIFFSLRLPERRFEYMSPATEEVMGFPAEAFLHDFSLLLRCTAPDWRAQLLAWVAECEQGRPRDQYDFQVMDRSGGLRWLRVRAVLVPAGAGYLLQGVAAAVDEAEAPAAASGGDCFRDLAEGWGEQLVLRMNLASGQVEFVSPGVRRITGHGPEDYYERPQLLLEAVAPRWRESVLRWSREVRHGVLRPEYEFEVLQPDGGLRWLNQRGVLLRDADGEPRAAQFMLFDVTERRGLEDALARANQRHSLLAEHLQDIVWSADRELRWTYLSPSVSGMLGLSVASAMARPREESFTEPSLRTIERVLAAWPERPVPGVEEATWLTLEVLDGAGQPVPIEILAKPLRGSGGLLEGYCGTARDIRPRLRRDRVEAALSRLGGELLECEDVDQALALAAACAREATGAARVVACRRTAGGDLAGPLGERLAEDFDAGALSVPMLHGEDELGRVAAFGCPEEAGAQPGDGPEARLERVAALCALAVARLRAQQALRRSERLSRMLLESMQEGVWAVDRDLKTIFVNERLAAMLGYGVSELMAMQPMQILDLPQKRKALLRYQERLMGFAGASEYEVTRKDGRLLPLFVNASPILDADANYEGLVMTASDLSERRRMEQELRRNQARFEALFELSRLSTASERQMAGFALREAMRLTGSRSGALFFVDWSARELAPMAWQEDGGSVFVARFSLDGAFPWAEVCEKGRPLVLAAGEGVSGMPGLARRRGALLAVPAQDGERVAAVLGLAGKPGAYCEDDSLQVSLLLDGMWRMVRTRRDEERIRASLREKEALLREVQHRVKNNLQVVSSLLDMAGRRLSESEGRRSLEELRTKVQAMSLVHAQLHGGQQGEDARRGVDLDRYVRALFRQLREIYSGGVELRLHMAAQDLPLGLDQATPLGLVLNEALANVFKHARREDRPGQVSIRAWCETGGEVRIEVQDDGPGLPEGFDPERAPSLGMKLMYGLVRHQLGGDFSVRGLPGGVLVSIVFRPNVVN